MRFADCQSATLSVFATAFPPAVRISAATRGAERQREVAADAAAGAGDERDLALEQAQSRKLRWEGSLMAVLCPHDGVVDRTGHRLADAQGTAPRIAGAGGCGAVSPGAGGRRADRARRVLLLGAASAVLGQRAVLARQSREASARRREPAKDAGVHD